MPRPPILAIVGRKNAGKTTLLVRLAATLHGRGFRVMTIKHGSHTFNIDPETTDTYRHFHEGHAERVAMAAPDKFALIMRWGEELSPEAIASQHMSDADIVLCEGFKRSPLPRIEVHRSATDGPPLLAGDAHAREWTRLLVADAAHPDLAVPVISLDDPHYLVTLADWVCESFGLRHP